MPRQKREKSGTGIFHVMQGKESKTCPYDSMSSNTFSDEEQAEFWDDFDNLQKAKIIR